MTAQNLPEVSVVIPALNEGGNIEKVITGVRGVLDRLSLSYEIFVIDGGSTDATREKAEACGAHSILQKRVGYGGALREGMMMARGRFILALDADCSHPPEVIEQLWNKREDAEIIVASRYVPGGTSKAPGFRHYLSLLVNRLFTWLLKVPLQDISSGFRLCRRSSLQPEKYRSEDFNILQEILVTAYAGGHRVVEVPFHYENRIAGASHVQYGKFVRSYLQTLWQLWQLRNSIESADYDHRAYDSRIPLQRYWQRKRYSIIKGYLEGETGILDIGCGSSRIIQSLPGAVAFDLARHKLRFIRRSNGLRVLGSTFALPFRDAAFTQLIHSEVIEHVPDTPELFLEMNRVLRPGGNLIVGTPDYGRIWWPIIEYFYALIVPNAYASEHITHYTRNSLVDRLAEHGFRVLSYRYICGGELIVKAVKLHDMRPS